MVVDDGRETRWRRRYCQGAPAATTDGRANETVLATVTPKALAKFTRHGLSATANPSARKTRRRTFSSETRSECIASCLDNTARSDRTEWIRWCARRQRRLRNRSRFGWICVVALRENRRHHDDAKQSNHPPHDWLRLDLTVQIEHCIAVQLLVPLADAKHEPRHDRCGARVRSWCT